MPHTRASLGKGSIVEEAEQISVASSDVKNAPSSDRCPACNDEVFDDAPRRERKKRTWVECEACKEWYHWDCIGGEGDLGNIDKWYCRSCLASDPSLKITLKPPARKSGRATQKRDYANLHAGFEPADANKWIRLIQAKPIKKDLFKRMEGADVTVDWVHDDENALMEPIIIESPDGLGMKMPRKTFTVRDVAETVGLDTPVEVMDVDTQRNSPGWTLESWAEYYNSSPESREKIRNVISLEITDSDLAKTISPPRLVQELDWVEQFWPANKRGDGQYPKVRLYCLMSVANCWTDWHVDFAGSSVYYHILRGSKVFYFIRPTPANLAAYEKWSGSELQQSTWLGDLVDEVVKVELTAGNTMIIPTGWIHAVFTPVDSLVFGGNFLHSSNIATQLRIREIEIATRVPKRFRYPMFERLCWYVAESYLRGLKAKEEFPRRVLEGLDSLSTFLVAEARILERGGESQRREVKDHVPGDKIKDPSALAREFRWRVRLAAGADSGDELDHVKKESIKNGVATGKRKRVAEVEDVTPRPKKRAPRFRGFQPRPWTEVERISLGTEVLTRRLPSRPVSTDGQAWFDDRDGDDNGVEVEYGVDARLERTVDEIVKVRRIVEDDVVLSVDREVVRRTMESWSFGNVERNGHGKLDSEERTSIGSSSSAKDEQM